jgi:hypothetical protein
MNTEKLDQALDQIGYQAALDWAPFRAASLRGVLVNIVAQPSVEVRKADREAVLALSEGVASIRESASNIREALPKLSASMRQILEGPSEFGALLEAFLEQCEVLEQIEPSATLAVRAIAYGSWC